MNAPILRTFGATVLVFLLAGNDAKCQSADRPTRPLVEIRTATGRMVVALFNETPRHRDNFLKLVREHAYDSTFFHRVVPGFTLQGGDPASRGVVDHHVVLGKSSLDFTLAPEPVPALVHTKGALAASHADDESSEKRSHGSLFYIVQGQSWTAADLRQLQQDRSILPGSERAYSPEQLRAYVTKGGAPRLDGDYTVFGEVVEGLDVIDRIAAAECDRWDRPITDIRMWMRELP